MRCSKNLKNIKKILNLNLIKWCLNLKRKWELQSYQNQRRISLRNLMDFYWVTKKLKLTVIKPSKRFYSCKNASTRFTKCLILLSKEKITIQCSQLKNGCVHHVLKILENLKVNQDNSSLGLYSHADNQIQKRLEVTDI